MSIAKNAMRVNLTLGSWQGYRLDKEASRRVTQEAGAEQDAARVNKHLVPREALKGIVTASGTIRTHFYAKTLPWSDNGDRLLTRKLYTDFIESHSLLVDAFNAEVETFLSTTYPETMQRAEFRMGDLFDTSDYPSPYELRRKFYVNLDIDAVVEAGDFRVEMDAGAIDEIRDAIEQTTNERIGRAMTDVWTRLADTLSHFATKMGDADAIFRDSTIHNLQEIVDLLPALNLMDDPELERMRVQVAGLISGVTPKELRANPKVRADISTEAQDILADMGGFLKAMGGGK